MRSHSDGPTSALSLSVSVSPAFSGLVMTSSDITQDEKMGSRSRHQQTTHARPKCALWPKTTSSSLSALLNEEMTSLLRRASLMFMGLPSAIYSYKEKHLYPYDLNRAVSRTIIRVKMTKRRKSELTSFVCSCGSEMRLWFIRLELSPHVKAISTVR